MKEKTMVAFRCPDCGVVKISEVSLFSLGGGEVNLRCSCGESVLTISYIKSRDTVSLSVPCVVCPNRHPYQVSATTFFGEELFILECSESGLDTCFIGDKDKVIEAVKKNTEELEKLFELLDREDEENPDLFHNYEHDCEDGGCHCHDDCHLHDEDGIEPGEYYDAVVTSQIMFILKELYDEGSIKCKCKEPDIMIDTGYDSIEVSCDKCGAKAVIRTKTDADIIELAQKKELILE